MDDNFSLFLESGGLNTEEGERREDFANLAHEDFKQAVNEFTQRNKFTP